MSHETHHSPDSSPSTPFKSSIWFMLVLAGLFIAAVNFVTVMGHDDEGHGGGHGQAHPTMEATSNQTLEGETGMGKVADDTTQHHSSSTPAEHTHTEGHGH